MSWRVHDFNKDGHGAILDEFKHELAVAGGDVRETPNGLELKFWRVLALRQVKQAGDQVSVDSLLNGWLVLKGEQFPKSRRRDNLADQDVGPNQGDNLVEVGLL